MDTSNWQQKLNELRKANSIEILDPETLKSIEEKVRRDMRSVALAAQNLLRRQLVLK